MHSTGVFESIPSSLSGEDAVLYGKIVSHAYSQYQVFPSALAKAFFEMLIFESVRDETLIESYKNFLTVNERNLLLSALNGTFLNQNETQELWDALTESNIRSKPNRDNIKMLTLKAAKYEFIQKPFFVFKSIQQGLKNVWNFKNTDEMDMFFASFKPTSENVLCYFEFDCQNPTEERIQSYFERYIRSCDDNELSYLIQFCTGSNVVGSGTVNVKFVNQEKNLRILAKSCFMILYLPRQLETFKQLKTLMDSILQGSQEYWEMHDN